MTDVLAAAPSPNEEAPGPRYPFDAPEPGAFVDVGAGVRWMRLPLPFSLEHINVYLIPDGEGWTLIDTGLGDPTTQEHWERAFESVLDGRPIVRVICTHMHPDHIGMAGWLCRRFDAPLWMTRLEYYVGRFLIDDQECAPETRDFYTACGWTPEQVEKMAASYGGFARAVRRMPHAYRRITAGEAIAIGDQTWTVVGGSGHCPEHACLWNQEAGLFLSGDQVLPRITSIVGVYHTEPASDPLTDWLDSCRDLKAALPDELLILPSHGRAFYGVRDRLQALIESHARRLERLEADLDDPKTVVETFTRMFRRTIGEGDRGMATAEALAHLNFLERRGRVARETGEDGAWRFRRVAEDSLDETLAAWR